VGDAALGSAHYPPTTGLPLRNSAKTDERSAMFWFASAGWCTEKEAVLAFQHNQDGVEGPLRSANLLFRQIITREPVGGRHVLQQATHKTRSGLVDAGYAEPGKCCAGLSLQRRLVKAASRHCCHFRCWPWLPRHMQREHRSIWSAQLCCRSSSRGPTTGGAN